MALGIEDYALIGDLHTGALVGRDGSIDWLCLPRYDSASVFGALLGTQEHGMWRLAPVDGERCVSREYLEGTLVLVSRWETEGGVAEVTDFMPLGDRRADLVRRVRGLSGEVAMRQELRLRFGYADALPWVRQAPEHARAKGEHALIGVAGPDSVIVRGPKLEPSDHVHVSEFAVREGETVDISFTWYPSHRQPPEPADVDERLDHTVSAWRDWAERSEVDGEHREAVERSLLLLRALTHEDTGGIVAAATTSLPEDFGGSRNWDYRYVWLRDAALTLEAFMLHGYEGEAHAWRNWLLRAIAGDPADVQIMYGLAGERRLMEYELDTLPGYADSSPVRVGNGAAGQFQGDVFGEVMLALEMARRIGVEEDRFSWSLQVALLDYVERNLDRDDHGIWEIRGPEKRFTHSRVMLWAAFACGVRGVEEHGLEGDVEAWRAHCDRLRHEIETQGFDAERNTFVQSYGSGELDAALLLLPQVGFVEPDDPRMLGTVAAIEKELMRDGYVLRYRTESGVDGLSGEEHPFLACSFWLVEQYARSGRLEDAEKLMAKLLAARNDVGMLSEEYDPKGKRHVGNTPQAFSHLTLVRAADAIARARGTDAPDPSEERVGAHQRDDTGRGGSRGADPGDE
ncbi:MAG: glycoside hydrolase family 15 protein [Actinomycetales bacterium]|nr:glycoside hydrolase family 15 protein [Actinomycetales bacterium]